MRSYRLVTSHDGRKLIEIEFTGPDAEEAWRRLRQLGYHPVDESPAEDCASRKRPRSAWPLRPAGLR